jgi:hypothetical protein
VEAGVAGGAGEGRHGVGSDSDMRHSLCDERIRCHFVLLRIGLFSAIMLSLRFPSPSCRLLRGIVDPILENVSNDRLGLAVLQTPGAGTGTQRTFGDSAAHYSYGH